MQALEVSLDVCPWGYPCRLLKDLWREKAEVLAENERLREIFQMAVREFEKRNERISQLSSEIRRLKEANNELRKKIEDLEGKNNLLSRCFLVKRVRIEDVEASVQKAKGVVQSKDIRDMAGRSQRTFQKGKR